MVTKENLPKRFIVLYCHLMAVIIKIKFYNSVASVIEFIYGGNKNITKNKLMLNLNGSITNLSVKYIKITGEMDEVEEICYRY